MGKKIVLSILALGLSVFLMAGTASAAATFKSSESVGVAKNETVDGSLFIAGSNVTIEGTVNGDVFCAGQTVKITGSVNGDVLCAAQSLDVAAVVTGDIRAAGQTIKIDSQIDRSITIFGQIVSLGETTYIGYDATVFSQTLSQAGQIGRDLIGSFVNLNVGGSITGSAQVEAENITVHEGATVGTIEYVSAKDATIEQGANVGHAQRTEPSATAATSVEPTNPVIATLSGSLYWLISMLIVGVAIMVIKPSLLPASAQAITNKVWPSIGWGALVLFIAPGAALVLLLTVVGIPLSIAVLLGWLLLLIISQPIAAHCFGVWLMQKMKMKVSEGWTNFVALLLGLVALGLLMLIPFVGWLVGLVAIIVGVGGVVLQSRPQAKKAQAKA